MASTAGQYSILGFHKDTQTYILGHRTGNPLIAVCAELVESFPPLLEDGPNVFRARDGILGARLVSYRTWEAWTPDQRAEDEAISSVMPTTYVSYDIREVGVYRIGCSYCHCLKTWVVFGDVELTSTTAKLSPVNLN